MILPHVKINKILYATDLSESSIHALAYAISLADHYKAAITILHVLYEDSNKEGIIRTVLSDKQLTDIKKRRYSEAREQLIGKKREDVQIKELIQAVTEKIIQESENQNFITDEIIVERGLPGEVILETAKNRNCDIVLVGSHGHKGISGVLMGSTASRVVKLSKIPVLVINLPE